MRLDGGRQYKKQGDIATATHPIVTFAKATTSGTRELEKALVDTEKPEEMANASLMAGGSERRGVRFGSGASSAS